jgi:hypothetical protein
MDKGAKSGALLFATPSRQDFASGVITLRAGQQGANPSVPWSGYKK